jgi:hypothetical protein
VIENPGRALIVPDTLEKTLDPAWLSLALGQNFPGVDVASVQVETVIARISTTALFRIECAGEPPEGLPLDLCLKGYFDRPEPGPIGAPEAEFYRDIAPRTGIRTLHSVYADIDPVTKHGLVISEDIRGRGSKFVDPLSHYSADQTAASLDQYATLHGRTWNALALDETSWLRPHLTSPLQTRGFDVIQGNFTGPIGAGVPEQVRDAQRLVDAFRALPEIGNRAGSTCLIHGDAHVGNLILDASGRPGIVDWQGVQEGPWYIDVGYHIATTLSSEERRANEDALLARYLDRLRRETGQAISPDEARRGFCCGIVYGFFLWGITLTVKPEITALMLTRLGTAALDHDAVAVVLAA